MASTIKSHLLSKVLFDHWSPSKDVFYVKRAIGSVMAKIVIMVISSVVIFLYWYILAKGLFDISNFCLGIKKNFPSSDLITRWKGVDDCPDCSKPSCRCLHDLSTLVDLYSYNTYNDIKLPTQPPMCDRQSRMIDEKREVMVLHTQTLWMLWRQPTEHHISKCWLLLSSL